MRFSLALAGMLALSQSFLACAETQAEKTWLTYEPDIVTLHGVIKHDKYPGPPNYGEGPDDEQVTVPVVHLESPINVKGKTSTEAGDPNAQSEENVALVQLNPLGKPIRLDGCMRVSGTLMHAVSAAHYTPVVMIVKTAAAASDCSGKS